jgi:hypothetical protein
VRHERIWRIADRLYAELVYSLNVDTGAEDGAADGALRSMLSMPTRCSRTDLQLSTISPYAVSKSSVNSDLVTHTCPATRSGTEEFDRVQLEPDALVQGTKYGMPVERPLFPDLHQAAKQQVHRESDGARNTCGNERTHRDGPEIDGKWHQPPPASAEPALPPDLVRLRTAATSSRTVDQLDPVGGRWPCRFAGRPGSSTA